MVCGCKCGGLVRDQPQGVVRACGMGAWNTWEVQRGARSLVAVRGRVAARHATARARRQRRAERVRARRVHAGAGWRRAAAVPVAALACTVAEHA
jgi:hypothetical protein